MKNFVFKIIFLCTPFFLFCQNNKPIKKFKHNYTAGVILSFDDTYVNDWFETNKELKKYSWKATFFVSKINALSLLEVNKLIKLQTEGNEIAGHGLHHYNAANFLSIHTIEEYLNEEIYPMLDLMNFYGLKISSFAYPYGGRTKELDTALLSKFKIVRGRAFCEENASKQGSYFYHSKLVFSFSIDDTHNHFNIPHLLKLLDFAKKNNKILILNSHKTVKNVTTDYETKNATLELICKYVQKNNMNFYTMSELNNFK